MLKLLEKGNNVDAIVYEIIHKWTKKINIFDYDFLLFPYNINNTHWSLVIISKIKQWVINMKDLIPIASNLDKNNEACFIYMDPAGGKSSTKSKLFNAISNYLSYEWKYINRKKLINSMVEADIKLKDMKRINDGWQKGIIMSVGSRGYTIQCNSKQIFYKLDGSDADFRIDDDDNLFKDLPRVDSPIRPIQPNWFDCGVYILKYGEYLLKIYPTTAAANRALNLGDQLSVTMFSQDEVSQLRVNYKEELLQLGEEQQKKNASS